MAHWAEDAIFYHLLPLAQCQAPARNDFASPPSARLLSLLPWLEHACEAGASALFLGPVFEASSHGYDTADFFRVDRRLGTTEHLVAVVTRAHELGMKVILDGVFGHVGRDFWAFRDLRERGRASAFAGWFRNLSFDRQSPLGDPFGYECWNGHWILPRLEHRNRAVREHLFRAVTRWHEDLGIDGLRLDTADELDSDFLRALRAHCERLHPGFWLMGEVIHGDYSRWANDQTLHSVTNYECFKGLWSSLNDRNYFEIAYALNRQFGASGLYRGLPLYNFVDNHDVDRVASTLKEPAHLFPLYGLLFTMPGVPSLYYGSELGVGGKRTPTDDHELRPCLDLSCLLAQGRQDLLHAIRRFGSLRRRSIALRQGDYLQLHVASEQLAFQRTVPAESVVVALNAAATPAPLELRLPRPATRLHDLLDEQPAIEVGGTSVRLEVPPRWLRVLRVQSG